MSAPFQPVAAACTTPPGLAQTCTPAVTISPEALQLLAQFETLAPYGKRVALVMIAGLVKLQAGAV